MSATYYRCIIVDDEALGRELIASHLAQLQNFTLVATCASAIEASEVLSTEPVDLMFLDIEMPVLKGTDFYKSLSRRPKVIFTTAYRDYAIDGFELEATDYLLKPITFARFFKSVERFLTSERSQLQTPLASSNARESIFVRVNRKDVRLVLSDVTHVQSLKDYVRIHTESEVYTVKETMTSIAERLGDSFVRIHRSYIVNRNRVTAVARHDVELGEVEVPIGETYQDEVLVLLQD